MSKAVLTAKKLINLSPEMVEEVKDFRFANRIDTESEAIRLLISRGLAFNRLDDAIETISHIGGEFLRGVPISNSDQLAFSSAIIKLFEAKDDANEELLDSLETLRDNLAAQNDSGAV
ncbi:hypothetical protein [Brucella intermedia]|uniref:hypothetical protein n=1 Tax=Brucella intermedia TaxID=94625 RepID=UPI0015910827|nr:hypothetical protein [Brucella intermedia]